MRTILRNNLNQYQIIERLFFIIFLIQSNKDLFGEIGFSKNDIIRLKLECKDILKEHHEE